MLFVTLYVFKTIGAFSDPGEKKKKKRTTYTNGSFSEIVPISFKCCMLMTATELYTLIAL